MKSLPCDGLNNTEISQRLEAQFEQSVVRAIVVNPNAVGPCLDIEKGRNDILFHDFFSIFLGDNDLQQNILGRKL